MVAWETPRVSAIWRSDCRPGGVRGRGGFVGGVVGRWALWVALLFYGESSTGVGGWWDTLGRSPDSVGRSLDSVGRTPDSVGHSLWPTGGGRAAAQVGAVGSLPLSRCATAPPRGERLDRVVRGATPGWQALAPRSARSVRRWLPRVGAAAGGGRAAAQVGGAGNLPLSRCATAPPRGERLDRVVRGATPGWQALAPRSARSVRRWLPRVGAAAGGGGGRAAAQVGAVGSLPLSRCATAPPRGERLDRAARGGLRAGRLWLADWRCRGDGPLFGVRAAGRRRASDWGGRIGAADPRIPSATQCRRRGVGLGAVRRWGRGWRGFRTPRPGDGGVGSSRC